MLYWTLGDTSGTTAADSSGNAHPGTYSGTFTLNQLGPETGTLATRFDPTGLASVASPLTGAADQSFLAYVSLSKPGSGANVRYPVVSNGDASRTTRGLTLGGFLIGPSTQWDLQAQFPTEAASTGAVVGWPDPEQFWHCLCVTYTTSTTSILTYIDGSLKSTRTTGTHPAPTAGDTFSVGCAQPVIVAHAALWNRVLTGAQITTLSSHFSVWPYGLSISDQAQLMTTLNTIAINQPANQTAAVALLNQIIAAQGNAAAAVVGTAHASLTGTGVISVSSPAAIVVSMTGSTGNIGTGLGNPTRYFELGNVSFGRSGHFGRNYFLEHTDEFLLASFARADQVSYSIRSGMTATITEILTL